MDSKAILILLLVAILGGGAYWTLQQDSAPNPNGTESNTSSVEDLDPKKPDEAIQAEPNRTQERTPAPPSDRVEVTNEIGAHTDAREGYTARLISPEGQPVAEAKIYMVPGVGLDTMNMFMKFQRGQKFPPLSVATSGADGRFRIGMKDWKDSTTIELRIVHPDFTDARVERLRLQPGEYTKGGDITLKRGAGVYGRITGENGAPIAGATVTARPNRNHGMISIPGREIGITVTADEGGNYEIPHLDPLDTAGLIAHAIGHTRIEKTEIKLQAGQRIQMDFQLEGGFEIGGVVSDAEGKPLRSAKILASAITQKSPQQEEAFCDADGNFLLVGLRKGMFSLMVDAPGYNRATEQPIEAGDNNVKIVLEKLGSVFVTVRGPSGPISTYTCNLKVALGKPGNYGKPIVSQKVRGAKGGTAQVTGVRPNTYVAEVFAKGFAKNFSASFKVELGQDEPPRVEVVVNQGGMMHGVLVDNAGKPISGATIMTRPDKLIDNKLIEAFGGAPYTISRGQVKTGATGKFAFKGMFPGLYQLKVSHPQYVTKFENSIEVVLNQNTDIGNLSMERGCSLSGIARLEGKPTGQVKVTITTQPPKGKQVNSAMVFNSEATTDNEGAFLFPKRVPPGTYIVRSAQPGIGPFMQMMQYQKKTEVIVAPGTEDQSVIVDVKPLSK